MNFIIDLVTFIINLQLFIIDRLWVPPRHTSASKAEDCSLPMTLCSYPSTLCSYPPSGWAHAHFILLMPSLFIPCYHLCSGPLHILCETLSVPIPGVFVGIQARQDCLSAHALLSCVLRGLGPEAHTLLQSLFIPGYHHCSCLAAIPAHALLPPLLMPCCNPCSCPNSSLCFTLYRRQIYSQVSLSKSEQDKQGKLITHQGRPPSHGEDHPNHTRGRSRRGS